MKKWFISFSVAALPLLGASASLADAMLFAPVLSAPAGGTVECHVTNVGKKTLREINVRLSDTTGMTGGSETCSDVPTVRSADGDHTCSIAFLGVAGQGFVCAITVTGGNHRSVRAALNVVDESGATTLSLPATK